MQDGAGRREKRDIQFGDRGVNTLPGLGSVLLGEAGKELRARMRGEEGWTAQRCQGPAWRPELGDTLRAGAPGWRGAGALSVRSTPGHLLAQASPGRLLHCTSAASSPSLGAQGCTETWGLDSGGGQDSRVLLVHTHSGPKAPWNHLLDKDLWRPLLAALPQQFKRTVPVANPDPQGPKTSGATFSGREVAQRPASTEVCLTIFTRIPNWSPSLPSSLHSQLGESR